MDRQRLKKTTTHIYKSKRNTERENLFVGKSMFALQKPILTNENYNEKV